MLNRRGISDSNIHRFKESEEDDQKLSSFLPKFLVKKIDKEDCTYKQSLFLDEENEDDEALEIKLDHICLNKETQHYVNNQIFIFFFIISSFSLKFIHFL